MRYRWFVLVTAAILLPNNLVAQFEIISSSAKVLAAKPSRPASGTDAIKDVVNHGIQQQTVVLDVLREFPLETPIPFTTEKLGPGIFTAAMMYGKCLNTFGAPNFTEGEPFGNRTRCDERTLIDRSIVFSQKLSGNKAAVLARLLPQKSKKKLEADWSDRWLLFEAVASSVKTHELLAKHAETLGWEASLDHLMQVGDGIAKITEATNDKTATAGELGRRVTEFMSSEVKRRSQIETIVARKKQN